MRLHEVELYVQDVEATKRFYHEILGLPLHVDEAGLKVFDSGRPGVELDASGHFPGTVSLSFLVDDLDAVIQRLRVRGLQVGEPEESHLGMLAVSISDPDGYRVEIQSPTDASPSWMRKDV